MQASFVIHFHTRRMDNLVQTLHFLEANHLEVAQKSELILICQDKCEPISAPYFVRVVNVSMDLPCMHLPLLTNEGIELASSDKIVVLESDRILPAGYFAEALEELHEGVEITTRKMVKLTAPATNDDIVQGNYESTCDDRSPACEFGIKNIWSGNTTLMKSDFNKVGQMDLFYKGYGWADCDMTLTMEQAGIRSIYKDNYTEIHLWHEGQTYGNGGQKQMYFDNCIYLCKKFGKPVPAFVRGEMTEHRKGKLFL